MNVITPPIKKRPLWKWALVLAASFILGVIGYGLLQMLALADNDLHPVAITIAVAVVLGLYALGVKLMEGHWPRDLGLGKLVPHTTLGLIVGFVYMTLVVSTIAATGCATVDVRGTSWEEIAYWLLVFLTVGVGEEIIFRGIIFRQIDERWNTWTALIVSALLFGFMHLPNDGATWWSSLAIAIEAGLMLAAAYKWSGTLWLPIGIHWAWNFTQGNVYGATVSGNVAGGSLLEMQPAGPDIITGGPFGPEASIVAVIFGVILTVIFLTNRYHRSPRRKFSESNTPDRQVFT